MNDSSIEDLIAFLSDGAKLRIMEDCDKYIIKNTIMGVYVGNESYIRVYNACVDYFVRKEMKTK